MNSLRSSGFAGPSDSNESTDYELLVRIGAGDHGALGLLIRRYVRPITLFAEQVLGDRDDAEDVAAETFLVVMRQAGTFDASRGEVRNWLYAIARSIARRSNVRKRRRFTLWQTWGMQSGVDPGPIRATEAREMLGLVARIMDDLPRMQRQCFELHVVRGLDVEEVATMFDVSPATVRQHVFRARRVIRDRLRPTEEA